MILSPVIQTGAYIQESVTGLVYLHVHDYDYSPDDPLPDAVASGAEPYLVVGAIAGG